MNNSTKHFSKSLRSQRKKLSLTQQELADLSNTSLNFISQLERGKETVRMNSLLSVIHVLGLEFFLRKGQNLISISDDISQEE